MNRIYLKANKDNSYTINDCLDHKKLGKVFFENKSIKIKNKYRGQWLENEATTLLQNNSAKNLNDLYVHFLQKNYPFAINLEHYPFPAFLESFRLKKCGFDLFNRPVFLHPAAKKAWNKMKGSAKKSGIELRIVSAFRDFNYQKKLIENKIKKGIALNDILQVNTLPGFSEHHTACAIDITTPSSAVLEPEFDQSDAFVWLMNHAHRFNFYLSYPKNNNTGILYEPWHWCYKAKPQ